MSGDSVNFQKVLRRMKTRALQARIVAYVIFIAIAFTTYSIVRDYQYNISYNYGYGYGGLYSPYGNDVFFSRGIVAEKFTPLSDETSRIIFRPSLTPPAIANAIGELAGLSICLLLIYVSTSSGLYLLRSANRLDQKIDTLILSNGDLDDVAKLGACMLVEDSKYRLL